MNHLARLQQSQRAKLLNRFQPGRKVKKLDEAGVRDAVSFGLLPIALLDDCRQYEQRSDQRLHQAARIFTRLCDGSADDDNHRQLYIAIQLAALRAEQIDAELAAQFAPALSALSRCKERRKSTSKYGLDGIGMQSVSLGH